MTVKVAHLRTHRVQIPLLHPFVTAVRRTDHVTAVIVEAVDTDGRSGWGEAVANWRVTGESQASIAAVVEGPLTQATVGREAVELIQQDTLADAVVLNAAARSAVDCALHDLAAHSLQMPLHTLLDAGHNLTERQRKTECRVRTDMSMSAASTDELVETALKHCARGFRTLKVKVGAGLDDAAAVAAVRAAVGPDISLRVDANQGWSVDQAVETIRFWEEAGINIELVEQPVPAHAIADLAYVTDRVRTTILADESVWTYPDLVEIVRRRAATMVNIKLAKTGGLGEARRMMAYANAHEVDVVVGCMMESHVGIAAAAALAASASEPDVVHDLDAGLWLAEPVVSGGVRYDGDEVVLAPGPGTGITGMHSYASPGVQI